MSLDPADEPPIDTSLSHYMEERALAIAPEKAATADRQWPAGRAARDAGSIADQKGQGNRARRICAPTPRMGCAS